VELSGSAIEFRMAEGVEGEVTESVVLLGCVISARSMSR